MKRSSEKDPGIDLVDIVDMAACDAESVIDETCSGPACAVLVTDWVHCGGEDSDPLVFWRNVTGVPSAADGSIIDGMGVRRQAVRDSRGDDVFVGDEFIAVDRGTLVAMYERDGTGIRCVEIDEPEETCDSHRLLSAGLLAVRKSTSSAPGGDEGENWTECLSEEHRIVSAQGGELFHTDIEPANGFLSVPSGLLVTETEVADSSDTQNRFLTLYDRASLGLLWQVSDFPQGHAYDVALSVPVGVISVLEDGTLEVVDAVGRVPIEDDARTMGDGDPNWTDVAMSPDGRWIAGVDHMGFETDPVVWWVHDGAHFAERTLPFEFVYSMRISNTGRASFVAYDGSDSPSYLIISEPAGEVLTQKLEIPSTYGKRERMFPGPSVDTIRVVSEDSIVQLRIPDVF